MNKKTRRQILQNGLLLGAGAAGASHLSAASHAGHQPCESPAESWSGEYDFGHTQLFMEEYHQGTLEILGQISGELEQVGQLTSRAAQVIRDGGNVWTSMNIGHMPYEEHRNIRRGNPGLMKEHEEFDHLAPGDMVFTNHCKPQVQAARDRGVYVVAVTVNYVNNEFRPADFTVPNKGNLLLKDVSNEILHSHVPYYQGLVHAPEIPEFTLCPSVTTGLGALHWMLNAELANKLAHGAVAAVDKSAQYLRILTEGVRRVERHMPRIRRVAVEMAWPLVRPQSRASQP